MHIFASNVCVKESLRYLPHTVADICSCISSGFKFTLSPEEKWSSAKFLICLNIKSAQMSLKILKMLSECQTARKRVRRRVTWRLTRTQAVCICYLSCAWRAKGYH